jgi:hypothetical protein
MANKGYSWSKAIDLAAQTIGDDPMVTNFPTRQQIDTAGDLDVEQPRSATSAPKDLHISIELAPDGLHITAEYIGTLASIPAAVERLRQAGLLDLIAQHRAAPAAAPASIAPATKPKAERVEPVYKPDGTACCPVHQRELAEGRFGPYCLAKAKPGELANEKGYCALRFTS